MMKLAIIGHIAYFMLAAGVFSFFRVKPLSSGHFTGIVVLFFAGMSVGCFNFFKALEKKIEILFWAGFASSIKNFGFSGAVSGF